MSITAVGDEVSDGEQFGRALVSRVAGESVRSLRLPASPSTASCAGRFRRGEPWT